MSDPRSAGTSRSTVREMITQAFRLKAIKFRAPGPGNVAVTGFTELPLATPSLNTGGWAVGSPGGIVVPRSGRYHFNGSALFDGPAVLTTLFGFIMVNGVIITEPVCAHQATIGELSTLQIDLIIETTLGDRVSFGVLTPAVTFLGALSILEATKVI